MPNRKCSHLSSMKTRSSIGILLLLRVSSAHQPASELSYSQHYCLCNTLEFRACSGFATGGKIAPRTPPAMACGLDLSIPGPKEGSSHGIHTSRTTVQYGRAEAAYLGGNARVPSRQASQGLRR